MKTITHKCAGMEREFRLDIQAAMKIEDATDTSLLIIANRITAGDVKFKALASILYHSMVKRDYRDQLAFDTFCEAIHKEGYINYLQLVGDLLTSFFLPEQQGEKPA